MRHNVRDYLLHEQQGVNQSVMSANGDSYMGADGFKDDLFFTDDLNQENFFMRADGGAGAQPAQVQSQDMPTSLPMILQISNASAATVSNFNLWNAVTYIGQSTLFTNGNFLQSGITVSSALPTANVTYQNLLANTISSPFTVGGTYMSSISGTATQVNQPIGVNTFSGTGNSAGKILTFPLSPNQYQSSVFINRTPYRVDGQTYLTLTILPSVIFQIWFYVSYDVNLSRALGDNSVGRNYKAPNITQPSVAVIAR